MTKAALRIRSFTTVYRYYYIKNVQGDVVQIRSSYGTLLVEYTYVLSITGSNASVLGANNPIRYRSYYYDFETGFYYLQSRYYDPAIRRFINADDVSLLGANSDFVSLNLYAYCGNNPVTRLDYDGNFWLLTAAVKVGTGLLTQYISDVIGNIADGKTGLDIFAFRSTVGEYIAAGVTALLPGNGIAGAIFSNVVSETIVNIEKYIKGEEINKIESVANIALGSIVDVGFDKVNDFIDEKIVSLKPINYSTYAGKQYKKNPGFTMPQIKSKMRNLNKVINGFREGVSFVFGVGRSLVPGYSEG